MAVELTRLRDIVAGRGAIAPVHVAFGTVLDEVEPGQATAHIPVLPPHRLRGPGVVAVLGDLVLSAAVTSTLPAGRAITTLTLHTAMLGPLPEPGTALVATAQLVQRTATSAVSRADVCASDGRPVAHLTSRSAVLALDAAPPLHHGDRDPDPFAALGTDLLAAPSLANSARGVQGGVLAALLGDRIEAVAVMGAGVADLDVTFLRAVPADGASMATTVEPVHTGRRLVVARAELRVSSGRVSTVAAATFWGIREPGPHLVDGARAGRSHTTD